MGRIVAYGDAIAAGIALANPPAINAGGAGRGLVVGHRATTTAIERGDHVIVSLGWQDVNAVFGNQPFFPPASYERRFTSLLQEILARNGGAPVALLGLEPLTGNYPGLSNAYAMPMNLLLEQIAHKARVHFVDLAGNPVGHRAADGMLYTRTGYQQLMLRAGHVAEQSGLPIYAPLRPKAPPQQPKRR